MTDPQPGTQAESLILPPDEFEAVRRSARILASIVARNHRVMEAARIEMLQNGPHAAMQWVLNSLPDQWDGDETAWDGKESAQEWFDRVEAAYRAAESDSPVAAKDESARESSRLHAPAQQRSGPSPADDREPLGRIVHEQRVALDAELAAAEGRERFRLGDWEDRTAHQRELDMRIGHAVANYALTENAATYDLACPRCAGFLDRAYDEHGRAEQAEAKLAEVRETVTSFLAHYGDSGLASLRVAGDLAHGILQVLDREAAGGGEGQERSEEKEAEP